MKKLYIKIKPWLLVVGQILIIVAVPIVVSKYAIGSFITINEEQTLGQLNVKLKNIPIFIITLIGMIALLCVFRKINKGKTVLKDNTYGSYPWILYRAYDCLGYKYVGLIYKPYNIQYKLLETNLFEIRDYKEEEFISEITTKITNKDSGNKQVNLIISDTYDIQLNQIPSNLLNNKTYYVNRITPEKGKRVFSIDLIDKVGLIINKYKNTEYAINLFMTTSISNTKSIFKNYILTGGRDKFDINLFLQSDKELRKFKEKPYIIKGGR